MARYGLAGSRIGLRIELRAFGLDLFTHQIQEGVRRVDRSRLCELTLSVDVGSDKVLDVRLHAGGKVGFEYYVAPVVTVAVEGAAVVKNDATDIVGDKHWHINIVHS